MMGKIGDAVRAPYFLDRMADVIDRRCQEASGCENRLVSVR